MNIFSSFPSYSQFLVQTLPRWKLGFKRIELVHIQFLWNLNYFFERQIMEIKTYFVTCLSKAKNFASGPASEWTNDQRALYWIFIDQIVCFITMIQFMHIMYKISLLYKHPKSVFRKKGFSFDEMFQYKTFQIFSSKFAIDLEYESHIHSRKYA